MGTLMVFHLCIHSMEHDAWHTEGAPGLSNKHSAPIYQDHVQAGVSSPSPSFFNFLIEDLTGFIR